MMVMAEGRTLFSAKLQREAPKLTDFQKKVLKAALEAEERALREAQQMPDHLPPIFDLLRLVTPLEVAEELKLLERPRMYAQHRPEDVDILSRKVRNVLESVRKSLQSLCRKGLLTREELLKDRGRKHKAKCKLSCYRLTDEGRKLAEKVRFEMKVKAEHLEGVIEELRRKAPHATFEEVLEALWRRESGIFEGSRELFSVYWNRKRLGAEMRGRCRLARVRRGGRRVWAYKL